MTRPLFNTEALEIRFKSFEQKLIKTAFVGDSRQRSKGNGCRIEFVADFRQRNIKIFP